MVYLLGRHRTDKAAKTFVGYITLLVSIKNELKEIIAQSDFISIFSDGSTDRTTDHKYIMIKVLDDYYPVMRYMMIIEPENTKAEGILDAVNRAFENIGITDFHENSWISVMMGDKRGVIKLFKDTKEALWVVAVWCLAHRLELAIGIERHFQRHIFPKSDNGSVEFNISLLQCIRKTYQGSS